ncbi:porin [Malikia sp.]|uniref:porin n=1 Tax=Malikia sp. TaxID=2070706 RepID=UPI00260A6547|nr:porin [Malikia sp.]MDD2729768.1 porin [Malikia sp.]
MKKSLIALAVLAAAGAASAQSSVTLYGRLDAGLVNVKDEINGDGVTRNKLESNVLNNSLWGMKGSEDLGGGLKANFVLEQGMSVDTGAPANAERAFHRQATVGLSGSFGSVDLGRNYPAYDTIRTLVNNTADTNMAVTNEVFANGGDYTNRTNNSIRFNSADYSGFSGAVSYGFGENKDVTPGAKSTDQVSLNVKYANGPVLAAYAHLSDKQADGSSKKYNLIGGAYDFGVVRLNAGYNTTKRTGSDDKEYQVGVSAPFGATTVYFGYANSKTDPDVGATVKRSGFDLAATYALSKRTTAYAGYKTYEVKDANKEFTAVGAGIRHVF